MNILCVDPTLSRTNVHSVAD